jgi:hypothetical protein
VGTTEETTEETTGETTTLGATTVATTVATMEAALGATTGETMEEALGAIMGRITAETTEAGAATTTMGKTGGEMVALMEEIGTEIAANSGRQNKVIRDGRADDGDTVG